MSTNVDPHYWDRVTSSAIDKAVIPLDINIYFFKKKEGPGWGRIRKTGLKINLKLSLTKGLKAFNMIMGSLKGCCDT